MTGYLARVPAENVGDKHLLATGAVRDQRHGRARHARLAGEVLDQAIAQAQGHVLPLGGSAFEAPAGQQLIAAHVEDLAFDGHAGRIADNLAHDHIIGPQGFPVGLPGPAEAGCVDDGDKAVQLKALGEQLGNRLTLLAGGSAGEVRHGHHDLAHVGAGNIEVGPFGDTLPRQGHEKNAHHQDQHRCECVLSLHNPLEHCLNFIIEPERPNLYTRSLTYCQVHPA